MEHKEMSFFESYIPMSDEEKKEHGKKFVETLNEIGIKDIKEFDSNTINHMKHETWIIK